MSRRRPRLTHPLVAIPPVIAAVVAVAVLYRAPGGPVEATPAAVAQEESNPCLAPVRSWGDIQRAGRLRVALPNDSTTYFLFRGETRGFEYELLTAFAKEHELELDVVRTGSIPERLDAARTGLVDLAGGRLAYTAEPGIDWSRTLYETAPSVIQQLDGVRSSLPPELSAPFEELLEGGTTLTGQLVSEPEELLGEEVWLLDDAAWLEDLIELEQEEGGEVFVVPVEEAPAESLVRWVSLQRIPLAVTATNVGRLSSSHYANVTVRPRIGAERPVAFASHCGNDGLLTALDFFLHENAPLRDALYRRYFVDRRGYQERVAEGEARGGRLSPWDDLLREAAGTLGWDWRLLAAQAYQESRFKPRARSWAGAVGVMQLMPAAARQVGVRDRRDPEQSIRGGAAYLLWLEGIWEDIVPDEEERLRFVLASYNAGAGHVGDARRLAEAFGDDPNVWSEVAPWLLRLADRHWYTQPEVRYGYCRGLEPTLYVAKILRRFEHYRALVPPRPWTGDPDEELLERARTLRGVSTELAPQLALAPDASSDVGRP